MKIKDLLTDESKWTKGAFAIGADGLMVGSASPSAVSWCLMGAVERCYGYDSVSPEAVKIGGRIHDYLRECPRALGDSGNWHMAGWNDAPGRTFADVRRLVTVLDI